MLAGADCCRLFITGHCTLHYPPLTAACHCISLFMSWAQLFSPHQTIHNTSLETLYRGRLKQPLVTVTRSRGQGWLGAGPSWKPLLGGLRPLHISSRLRPARRGGAAPRMLRHWHTLRSDQTWQQCLAMEWRVQHPYCHTFHYSIGGCFMLTQISGTYLISIIYISTWDTKYLCEHKIPETNS